MNRSVDLDAARVARAEAIGDKPTMKFAGKEWELPAELPWAFVEATSGDIGGIVRALEGLLDSQWADFQALHPTVTDITTLVEAIPRLYGLDGLGE
jgi:hypothetical protein